SFGGERRLVPLNHPMTRTLYEPAAWLARRLPRALAYAIARACARLAWSASASRREAMLANLAHVLPAANPRARRRVARRTFETFAESLVDGWRAGAVSGRGAS